jgi:hypothetical protein
MPLANFGCGGPAGSASFPCPRSAPPSWIAAAASTITISRTRARTFSKVKAEPEAGGFVADDSAGGHDQRRGEYSIAVASAGGHDHRRGSIRLRWRRPCRMSGLSIDEDGLCGCVDLMPSSSGLLPLAVDACGLRLLPLAVDACGLRVFLKGVTWSAN